MGINTPPKPFPDGDKSAKPAKESKSKAKPAKVEPDELDKFVTFFEKLDEENGGSEGFSAQSPDQIQAKGVEAGLNPEALAQIINLVSTFGPQVMTSVTALLALLRKKKTA